MTLVDNHNHILLAEITEMLAAAKVSKVSEYSITEHVSQFREPRESIRFGSIHPTGRIFESLKEYKNEFRTVDQNSDSGMEINCGLEVDFSPRFEKRVGDFVNQEAWDILLCAVHEFEDGKDIEKGVRRSVEPVSAYEHWREYLRLQQMALERDFVPYKVLAHPVRMSRATKVVPSEIEDLLLDLARIARKRNKSPRTERQRYRLRSGACS